APADGQAQARTTRTPLSLGLHLNERLEYDFPLALGHAFAGVDDIDSAPSAVVAGQHTHSTQRSELQSVGNEVGQDLLDTSGVTDKRAREYPLDGHPQLEAERQGPRPSLIDHFVEHARQVKWLVLQRKGTCFDATQIEYVIGDVEKGAGRHARNTDTMSAFG